MGVDRFTPINLGPNLRGPGDLPTCLESLLLRSPDQQTLVAGASAAFGPRRDRSGNAYADLRRGPLLEMEARNSQSGFPFVSWATEGRLPTLRSRAPIRALTLPAETLPMGLYSRSSGVSKTTLGAGLRGEYVNGNAVFMIPTTSSE